MSNKLEVHYKVPHEENTMQYWLMKTEPSTYSLEDLKREGKTAWEGVRNYQARNFMRDGMEVGDKVIIYHSNAMPSAAVGEGKVCSKAYPDRTQFDSKSKYFDAKASTERPIWQLVDICYENNFKNPVSIERMRTEEKLQNMIMLKRGSRLSITPLTSQEYEILVSLGK